MNKPLVVILMGSKSDLEHCEKIAKAAKTFGLDVALRIGSAHKTAEHTLSILHFYEQDARPKVYITVAGRSNALSGFTDGAVSAPVIACPPYSEAYAGADIFSSLRMPSSIAPATVLEPANAALLAAKILGLVNSEVRDKVKLYQHEQANKILNDDQEIQTKA
jgi:5-(carboxyamino)imidazole ribonucleotide mutase/phosphoribosylaminoimidazole-succinocarboxamide synthase